MTLANEVRVARLSESAAGIRRSQVLLREQTDEFKTLVREAHAAGMSIRAIASATGFVPSWIGTICRT